MELKWNVCGRKARAFGWRQRGRYQVINNVSVALRYWNCCHCFQDKFIAVTGIFIFTYASGLKYLIANDIINILCIFLVNFHYFTTHRFRVFGARLRSLAFGKEKVKQQPDISKMFCLENFQQYFVTTWELVWRRSRERFNFFVK